MKLLWCVLALSFFSLSTFAKECSLIEIYGHCEKLKDGSFGSKKSDGTIMPNLYTYYTVRDSNPMFLPPEFRQKMQDLASPPADEKANEDRLNGFLDFIKKVYIEEALAGRKEDDPQLDEGTKAIIARVKNVSLRFDEDACEISGALNANYNTHNHTVNVCNGIAKMPDLTVLFVLAHEVGHSIDTCRVNSDLLQIVPDVGSKKCEDSKYAKEKRPDDLANFSGQYMAADENVFRSKYLVSCGFAKVISPRQSHFGKNNIAKTVSCVSKTNSKEALSIESFEQFVSKYKIQQKYARPGLTAKQLDQLAKKNEKSLRAKFENYKATIEEVNGKLSGCNMQPDHHNSAAERSSDLLATRVVSKYIQGKTLSAEQKMTLIEFQAQLACGFKLSNGKLFSSVAYPNGEERLNILLQDPNIQSALGCTYTGKKTCSINDLARAPLATPAAQTGGQK